MITHISAGFDGAVAETRSLRTGTPVGQQRPGAAMHQAQVFPHAAPAVSRRTGCSRGDWRTHGGSSASEPRGKASVKTNRLWGLLAWSSWLPRSLNFTNGWTSEEVLCKSTLQWCSLHFFQVRALNFGYTLFKISWQFLIKVLSTCGSNTSSALRNSQTVQWWGLGALTGCGTRLHKLCSTAGWGWGGWGLSGRWNKRKKIFSLKTCELQLLGIQPVNTTWWHSLPQKHREPEAARPHVLIQCRAEHLAMTPTTCVRSRSIKPSLLVG